MSSDSIYFQMPKDFGRPISLIERNKVRSRLINYLDHFGSRADKPMSPDSFALMLTEYAGDVAPSKTPIVDFLNGSSSTKHKTVRLIKQYLDDSGFEKNLDVNINLNGSEFVEQYQIYSDIKLKNFYGEEVIFAVDPIPEFDIYFNFNIYWKLSSVDDGVYEVEEIAGRNEFRTGPRGRAICNVYGEMIGYLRDSVQERLFRFTLKHVDTIERGGVSVLIINGVINLLTNKGKFPFNRKDIKIAALRGVEINDI